MRDKQSWVVAAQNAYLGAEGPKLAIRVLELLGEKETELLILIGGAIQEAFSAGAKEVLLRLEKEEGGKTG